MGSLPNLRSLSNDPNTTYKYELCEPGDVQKPGRNQVKQRHFTRLPTVNSNSQNEINRFKTNQDRNIQLKPHISGATAKRRWMETAFDKLSLVIQRNSENVLIATRVGQELLSIALTGNNMENSSVHGKYHHYKVRQTRSSGSQCNYYIHGGSTGGTWEDNAPQLQMSTNSPVSNRSSRSNYTAGPNSVIFSTNQTVSRRRDSLSSSGGTSSVRRLIAVVRSTPSRFGPIYSRRVLCRNFAALCLGHATITAALLPLLSLQSSVSAWWWPHSTLQQTPDVGSLLLSGSFAIASVSSLFSPCIIHLLGCNWTLVTGYLFASIFFAAHLYPTIRWLVPAYVLLGLSLGPIACARISYLVTLANKLTYVMTEEEEEYEQLTGDGKDNIMQKLSRGLQASQDLGMVIGSAVAWFFLSYSQGDVAERNAVDVVFQEDDSNERVCGSQSCPVFGDTFQDAAHNATWNEMYVVPCRTTTLLSSVFVGCGVVAVGLTAAFTDKIRLFIYQDPRERPAVVAAFQGVKSAFKDPRLQLAAPLSVFIGLQQGFIFADFSKWYVVCSLSISNISLVFLSMGLLQSVAAFTLSLLMQIVPRYLVIGTGFTFHSCLLLVLLMWKPSGDDSALFYVIAAAWGVCNIIWETLNFTLLMHIYPDSTWHAAFVHGNFFKFLGLSLAFGLHGAVCTWVKLYGLTASMLIGIIPHVWLEMKLEAGRKTKSGVTAL